MWNETEKLLPSLFGKNLTCKAVHDVKKQYHCDCCSARFSLRIQLNMHYKKVHDKIVNKIERNPEFVENDVKTSIINKVRVIHKCLYLRGVGLGGIMVQLWNSDYKRLQHKPYVNEVYLTGQNLTSNCS